MTDAHAATTEPCSWCPGTTQPGSTCPRAVECPTCRARPGRPCKRPSGHRAPRLHAPRIAIAEDADRAAQVPWTLDERPQLALAIDH